MRIAIVGSGISGLVCARRLQGRHEITLFEAADRLGGHTHTVPVSLAGRTWPVDTGFVVFNRRTYPQFCRLLEELGVSSRESDMSFGVSCERTGLEYATRSVGSLLAQPRNLLRPSFRRMLRDVLRFHREARQFLQQPDEKATLEDWLTGRGYSTGFVEHFLVPMGSAIWSTAPSRLGAMPALTLLRFFDNHGLLDRSGQPPWRVVEGGSCAYVERLVAPWRDRVRLGCPVRAVRRTPDGVQVSSEAASGEHFDRLILALHSDQALAVLRDPSPEEVRVLGAIRYQENEAVLHTDASLLPHRRRAWASWNVRVPRDAGGPLRVTYHMNRLQRLDAPVPICVTLNGGDAVDPGSVIARMRYEHPLLDGAAVAAQRHFARIDGRRHTHYCGAYWGYGFHEDGVRSALRVVERIECGPRP